MEIILVPSTLCNLRCSYCYELSALGDKRRMTLETLELVYERLAAHFEKHRVQRARIIWHGGEPLLLPPDFYWRAFELQRSYFRGIPTHVRNLTQTNLTVLDAARAELLEKGFDQVGVSLDLFGSLRVDGKGQAAEHRALANLEVLLARGVRPSGITVLTRANRLRVARIYQFYRDRRMGFRLLPLHAGDFAAGQWFEISPEHTLRALITLADLWMADPEAPAVDPVVAAIRDVYLHHASGEVVPLYDKLERETLVAVDREGYVNSYEHLGQRAQSYGRLADAPLDELLESPARLRIAEASRARVAATCAACPHFAKTCSSYPVAEGRNEYWEASASGIRCTAYAGLLEHISARLRQAGALGVDGVLEPARLERSPDAAATWSERLHAAE